MAAAAQKRTVKKATRKRALPKTSAAGGPAAKRATTKKATTKKATSKKATTKRRPTKKPSVLPSTAAAPATASHVEPKQQRSGPVLGAYRLSLTAIEGVTVGVGGLALGSLGELGLPKKATGKLKNGHAGAIRGATKASDYVGTKVAKVIGKTVAVGSRTATWAFPE